MRLSARQSEVNLYFRIYFDRFAVEQVRLVFPLLHRLDCRRSQHWMPTYQGEVFDRTILADHRMQHDLALNAGLPRQRRIGGIHFANQKSGRYTLRYPHALWGRDFRHGYRRGTDNAADYAAHLA